MKKILTILCCAIICGTSYSETLCKRNSTAFAILDKNTGGTVDNSTAGVRWVVNMTDGNVVKGYSQCNDKTDNFATLNTEVPDTHNTGINCYCKMMAPATSYWVNASGSSPYATETDCENACVNACANYMATNQTFRSAVYESIW